MRGGDRMNERIEALERLVSDLIDDNYDLVAKVSGYTYTTYTQSLSILIIALYLFFQ